MPGTDTHGHVFELREMIGLSVAVGRFVEALFWAIIKVVGWVAVAVVAGFAAMVMIAIVLRKLWAKRR